MTTDRALLCPCCGYSAPSFNPFGVVPRPNAMCPACGALERHRHFWLFAQRHTALLQGHLRILHVAPERVLGLLLRALPAVHYVSVDLLASGCTVRADLQALPWPDGAFDVVLCSHVLEHVADDRQAMRELARVLRPTGWALVQSPIDASRSTTFEQLGITDPASRERLFGQRDHVRVYGADYRTRLEEAGFSVRLLRFELGFQPVDMTRHALLPEDLYLCHRTLAPEDEAGPRPGA